MSSSSSVAVTDASQWVPDPNLLNELRTLLTHSLSADKSLRIPAEKALENARSRRDLGNYLVYILLNPANDSSDTNARASSALALKNNIRMDYESMDSGVLDYIRGNVLNGLMDKQLVIRNVAGNIVTTLISKGGILSWPAVFSSLLLMAENSQAPIQEGAMSALAKICEDTGSDLDKDYGGERPLNFMIPKFLQLASSPTSSSKVKGQSIYCLNQFILLKSQSLLIHIDDFLSTLFQLASNPDAEIRRNVCLAFTMLLNTRPDKLFVHLSGVVDYCLHSLDDQDEQVAVEACEFFLSLAECSGASLDSAHIEQYLPKILPNLISKMVYSEMDQFVLNQMKDDDAQVADRQEDIKPVIAKSKDLKKQVHENGANKSKGEDNDNNNNNNEDEQEEEDDENDEFDDMELGLSGWNLRKCAAASLDVFATRFPDSVLPIVIPHLKERVISTEWPVREAAILAFGAIAEGCINIISTSLPELVPFLVSSLKDSEPPVRQISCWTLGRYSQWICFQTENGQDEIYFAPVLKNILDCCLDNNKKVQESGCSAFATIVEPAGKLLVPYVEPILQHFAICFHKYQHKNLIILYDAVQTFVDRVGYTLKKKEYMDLLLPPLIEKWGSLGDDDRDLFPLLECMSTVTASLGDAFAPYAKPVFDRAVLILKQNLIQEQEANMNPILEQPDKDFRITSLDLLDGLVQGMGILSNQLIETATNPPLMQLVMACLQDGVADVRQSCYALLGDLAINAYPHLSPYISGLMTELIPEIDISDADNLAVCNNAIWASSEISLHMGNDFQPYVEPILDRLFIILQHQDDALTTILENVFIAIGRLGLSFPQVLAPTLASYIDSWLKYMTHIRDTNEKSTAFKGICQIIVQNPGALKDSLAKLVLAIGLYQEADPSLKLIFRDLLRAYHDAVPDWDDQVVKKLPPAVAEYVHATYFQS